MFVQFRLLPALTSILVLSACSDPPSDLTAVENARLANPAIEVQVEVARLIPAALAFIDAVDARALSHGRPLSPDETSIALRIGVAAPELVRIYTTQTMPHPADPDLADLFIAPGIYLGFTSGYGITLKRGFGRKRWLVAHELAHVHQFEVTGRAGMAARYLTELMVLPDTLIPIEREANAAIKALADEKAAQK